MAAIVLGKLLTAAALAVASHPPQDPVKDPGQTAPKQNPSYFNPQMAVIGDFAAVLSDNSGERRHADFREIEIGLASDVDPFLKVVGFFSIAKEDGETKFEAEEVFGTYSKFGKGIQAKFGKIAAAVGRVQRNHVDQLDYLNYPLPITDVLGDEGMRVGGASFSYLFPGDRFMEITGEILDAGDDGPVFNGSDLSNPAFATHFRTFFDFTEDLSAQLGLSYLNAPSTIGALPAGVGTPTTRRGDMYGVDYTMKWRPGQRGKSASLEAEAYWTKPGGASERTKGAFGRAAYEIMPRIHLTTGYDYSEIPGTSNKHQAWLAGVTLKVTEFEHWRLEFQRVNSNFEKDRNLLTLQFQWIIGAHPAHKY